MCKVLGSVILFFLTAISFAADTPHDKLLKAAKVLAVNSADQNSFDVLKGNLDLYKEPTVKSSLVKVMSFALLNSDKSKFESFKAEIKSKYPSMDFSFVDANASDYKPSLRKNVNYLVLNASSALAFQKGEAPYNITVNPRKDSVEPFEKIKESEIAKVDNQKVIRDKKPIKEIKPAIDKESVFYKVYHAALAAQSGDKEAIRDLVQLTFEKKPEELTSAIVKSITLGMLSFKSKATNGYIIKVNSVYLDNAFLTFLYEQPFSDGKRFNKAIFKPEFEKALQYVVDLTPKLAQEANVNIGVELDETVLAKIAKVREVKRAKEAAEKARLKAEREAELAKLEKKKKKPKVKTIKQGGRTIIVTEFDTTDGESNANLDYAVFEFDNFYKVQQKRTGSSIYKKAYGKYEGGRAILYMEVTSDFQSSGRDYKEQILEGCYQFFKLRAGANGAGGNVDVKMVYNTKTVAGTKKGKVYFN